MLEAEEVQGEPPAAPAPAQLLPGALALRLTLVCAGATVGVGGEGATLRVLGVIF